MRMERTCKEEKSFVIRYVTETLPERERLKKEKEEATLAHHKRVAEVKNHNPPISILVCVVDVHGISNYATHGQGRLHARHSFCDPNYDRARSEVEGKVHRQQICFFLHFI